MTSEVNNETDTILLGVFDPPTPIKVIDKLISVIENLTYSIWINFGRF